MWRALPSILLAMASNAWGCGYCVEDTVASTYDHAVVTRAVGAGHHVVFYHLDGPLEKQGRNAQALRAAAEALPGVDRGSVRVSLDTLTLSFAFDPRRASLGAMQGALDKRLAAHKLSAFPIRVLERPGELKEAQARRD